MAPSRLPFSSGRRAGRRLATRLWSERVGNQSVEVALVEPGAVEPDERLAKRPPCESKAIRTGDQAYPMAFGELRFGHRTAVDRSDRPPTGDVDFAQQQLRCRAAPLLRQPRREVALAYFLAVGAARRAEQHDDRNAGASACRGQCLQVVDRLSARRRWPRVQPKRGPRQRAPAAQSGGARALRQAMPGLPATPLIVGWLSLTGFTTFWLRRYVATTSQIGSPLAPSATGAQPATL